MYRQKQIKIHKIDCKSEIDYINIQVSAYNYWCFTYFSRFSFID